MYQIAIVEDDEHASKMLSCYLERYGEENGEKYEVSWFANAIDFEVSKRSFDLVFLDIQLPGISGMETAQLFRTYDEETPIIFVTNLAQYAVKGYEVDALDFIVKPVQYFDFRLRMDRAMRHIKRNSGQKIVAKTQDGMRVITVSDIAYVEVKNHSLDYHLANESAAVTVYGTLSGFEREVAGSSFVRISNSCLANMNHIKLVRGGELIMSDGTVLYFSRSKKHEAVATITSFLGGSL